MKPSILTYFVALILTIVACQQSSNQTSKSFPMKGTWIVLSNSYQSFTNSNLEFSQTDYEQEQFIFDGEGGFTVTDAKNEQKIHYIGSYKNEPYINIQLDGEFVKFKVNDISHDIIRLEYSKTSVESNKTNSENHIITLKKLY